MRAFFIAGNKRSGSSLLVRLLNFHPRIFISHESDIIWILYNLHHRKPFLPYPSDDPGGMHYTLAACGHLIDKAVNLQEAYFTAQRCLMEKGFAVNLPPMSKKALSWIGDKKPFQYADPVLVKFILSLFPDALFLHLVRHPFAVARSAKLFQGDGGYLWKDLTPEEIVAQWAIREKQIMELKQKLPDRFLDIRYEDLCGQTDEEFERILSFLAVNFDGGLLDRAARMVKYHAKLIPKVSCNEETVSIMKQYDYMPVGDYYP